MAVGRARFQRTRSARIILAGLVTFAFGSTLVACDSGDSSSTPATIPAVTPKTAPYTYGKMRVDLKLTGTHTATISGVTGSCRIAPGGMPKAFIVPDRQFGRNGFLVVYGPTAVSGVGVVPPSVKAIINGSGLLSPNNGQGVTVRPDLQSVTVNTKIAGPLVGANGTVTGWATDTVTGTLRCV